MSTITPTPPMGQPEEPTSSAPSIPIYGDKRMLFPGVPWETYRSLSEAIGESEHVRLTYDGKDLEILTVGNIHEMVKGLTTDILDAVAMGLDVDYVECGETTWDAPPRGLQADLSYYFDAGKIRIAREAAARGSKDPNDYPRPDMAVEIDMSAPQNDRLAIYRDLTVAEVWRLVRLEKVMIEQLQPDGSYAAVPESRFLRVRSEDVLQWIKDGLTARRPDWNRRLRQWATALGQQAP